MCYARFDHNKSYVTSSVNDRYGPSHMCDQQWMDEHPNNYVNKHENILLLMLLALLMFLAPALMMMLILLVGMKR